MPLYKVFKVCKREQSGLLRQKKKWNETNLHWTWKSQLLLWCFCCFGKNIETKTHKHVVVDWRRKNACSFRKLMKEFVLKKKIWI